MKKLLVLLILSTGLFASRPFISNEFPVVSKGTSILNFQLNASGKDDHVIWLGHGFQKSDLEILIFPKLNYWKATFLVQPLYKDGSYFHFGPELSAWGVTYQATLGYISKNVIATVNPSFLWDLSIQDLKALIEVRLGYFSLGSEAIFPRQAILDHEGQAIIRLGAVFDAGPIQPHIAWDTDKEEVKIGATFVIK